MAVSLRGTARNSLNLRISQFFMERGVGAGPAADLADVSYLHMYDEVRYHHWRNESQGSSSTIEVVVSGVVSAEQHSGVVPAARMWGPGWWLGDLDMFRESGRARSEFNFLSPGRTLRIPRDVLRSSAMRHLSVQRMLQNVLAERYDVLNEVYGLDGRPSLSRLAQLIVYLTKQPLGLRDLWPTPPDRLPGRETALQGPTQGQLAASLGLSQAAVEKCMRLLRKHGVLVASGPGRANRTYTIANVALLDHLASGFPLPEDPGTI
jgi:hypothetical protein